MKHIYLTLLSIVFAAGYVSAQQVYDLKPFQLNESPVSAKVEEQGVKKAPTTPTCLDVTEGQYCTLFSMVDLNARLVRDLTFGGYTEVSEIVEDEYTLKDFLSYGISMETFDLQASVTRQEGLGTMLSIPGEGQTPLFSSGGEDYCLWSIAYSPSLGKFAYVDGDIVFIVYPDNTLALPKYNFDDSMPDDAMAGIAFMSKSGRGSLLVNLQMHLPNGVMKTMQSAGFSTDWEYQEYPLYLISYPFDIFNAFDIWGMGGAYYPCSFMYSDSGFAAAIGVAFVTQQYGNLYYTEDLEEPYLGGKYSKDDEKETITIDHQWWIGNSDMVWMSFTDTTIERFLNTSGIEKVEIAAEEEAEQAPEYYNLMGIRIANPIPGQIYILKRGTSASKLIY